MSRVLVVGLDRSLGSYHLRVRQVMAHANFRHTVVGELFWNELDAAGRRGASLIEHARAAEVVLVAKVVFRRPAQFAALWGCRPIAYDFDDAIYAVPSSIYQTEQGTALGWVKRLRRRWRRGRADFSSKHRPLGQMLRRVDAVAAGNDTLVAYAGAHEAQARLVATSYDVARLPVKHHAPHAPVVIGWYGAPDSQWYLQAIVPAMRQLLERYGRRVCFQLISAEPYRLGESPLEWVRWQPEREVEQLLDFDIGVMPLVEDEWARGKSAAKAIYSMALGIPVVVSPVGVNATAVIHGHTGFHARSVPDWVSALSALAEDAGLRKRLGENARQHAQRHFSLASAATALSEVLEAALERGRLRLGLRPPD
jgi:hypothetical protein